MPTVARQPLISVCWKEQTDSRWHGSDGGGVFVCVCVCARARAPGLGEWLLGQGQAVPSPPHAGSRLNTAALGLAYGIQQPQGTRGAGIALLNDFEMAGKGCGGGRGEPAGGGGAAPQRPSARQPGRTSLLGGLPVPIPVGAGITEHTSLTQKLSICAQLVGRLRERAGQGGGPALRGRGNGSSESLSLCPSPPRPPSRPFSFHR